MTLEDLKNEAVNWRFTKYKLINLSIGLSAIYEIGQPLLGKPIDFWDILATLLSGGICFFLFKWLFGQSAEIGID